MTDREQKIMEIREALQKATPGPWKWVDPGGYARKALVGEWEIMNFGASMPYSEVAGQEPDDTDAHLIANAPEWLRFLLSEYERSEEFRSWAYENIDRLQTELDRRDEENRKLREKLDAVAEGYRQQVKLAGELMDKLSFVQEQEQKLIKKLREITKLLGGVTFTDGRQWGAYNALCDILEEIEKELSK